MIDPYPSYKDSGVEWIGEIPSGWELKKLKYVSDIFSSSVDRHIHEDEIQVSICHYPDVYNNEFISDEIELNKGSCSEVEFQRYILKKGLVILTKDSETPDDIGNPCYVEIDFDNVVCGYHLTIIENNDIDVNSKFLFRFIQSDKVRCHFETESRGITRFSLGKSKIENLFVNLPPLTEQTKIVSFLDIKTQKIDALIEKTERKIALLQEKRTSLINHCVTKGLDPNVMMKDSGVEWIGDIPSGWDLIKLRYYLTKVGSGVTPRGGGEVYSDEGIKFLRSQNIHFDGLHLSDVVFITEKIYENMKNSQVNRGDILLNITGGSIGRCCVVNVDEKFNLNQHVSILRTKSSLYNDILNYNLMSSIGQEQVQYNQTGGNRDGLTSENIKNFQIGLPPLTEQTQIVDYLDEQTQKIDTSIEQETQRIALLKEYRQSLISEVVTGKVRVTKARLEAQL